MENLKSLRKSQKLTQQSMADYLGITQKQYSNLENGISVMSAAQLSALADYFGVTTDHLLDRDTLSPKEKTPAPEEQGQYALRAARETPGTGTEQDELQRLVDERVEEALKKYGLKKD